MPLGLVSGEQQAQPADDFTGAQVVAANLGKNFAQLAAPVGSGFKHQFGGVGVAQNGAERLVDLVRNRAGH